MNTSQKSTWILVATFFIGILLGGTGYHFIFAEKKHERKQQRERKSFTDSFLQRIGIEDADQQAKVRPILERYDSKFKDMRVSIREQMKANSDSLKNDLTPLLTPEQLEKFNERLRRKSPRKRDDSK